jgi:hypothetical protein
MSKIIIGIHGLGNKPSKPILTDWWRKSILEGLKKYNHSAVNFEFELAYWADILNPKHQDPNETSIFSSAYVNNRYLPENTSLTNEFTSFRIKAMEYLDKFYGKIVVNEVLSLKYPSFTDLFIHINMPDLEKYYTSQMTRQLIIERLIDTIKRHKGKDILLISHSMGSIISHDALTDYLPDIKIDTLITMGSPLGQKYVLQKLLQKQKDNPVNKLQVPCNIKRNWYNISDLEDQVALNHLLAELYVCNSKSVKVSDKLVQNNYTNNGVRDTHSSYGYLRTPELAEIVQSFLTYKKFRFSRWFRSAHNKS